MCVLLTMSESAFDRVYHDDIMKCFAMIDMESKDRHLIGNLYWGTIGSS